jgi:OOP family OmpA-OmpF porin
MKRLLPVLALLWSGPGAAQVIDLPANATLEAEEAADPGDLSFATGPFRDETVPMRQVEGAVTRQVWRIRSTGLTTLQIFARLRDQLEPEGFATVYDCAARDCGGFDFRFRLTVAGAPEMYVDLGDYRYLVAEREGEVVEILVSRSALAGFIQITYVAPSGSAPLTLGAASEPRLAATAPVVVAGDLAAQLEGTGRAVLPGLTFETGSATLGAGPFPALEELAAYLLANPSRRVGLVGHTDSEGSLEGNIGLSKRRAGSVLERLASEFGVPRQQMEAEGMGYLSPVAPNTTPEGREANRRVEVILVSTE